MAAALLALAGALPAHAAGRIISVEPASVQQGDTVLLTIKGEQLPSGNVRVEFFPQQIAVLSTVLAADGKELTAQIKVPPLATPGAYNVMVSNQLGDEAFGQALLTIVGTVRTPVFKSYDPKVIARADNGFALILTGEQLAPEVAPRLQGSWQRQDGSSIGGLTTTFTYAPGQIICVVTGRMPNGNIRGKIALAGKPIYQVEVEVRGGTAIIGHTPSTIRSADGPMVLRLVGDDLSAGWLSKAKVSLRFGKKELPASRVALRDGVTGEVEFTGPLPVGDWTVVVAFEDVAIYQGPITILPALPVPKVIEPPAPPAQDLREVLDNLEAQVAPAELSPMRETQLVTEVEESTHADTINNAALILDSLSPPDDFQMTEVQIGQPTVPGKRLPTASVRIENASFTPGADGSPARLVLTGINLTADLLERLQVELTYKGRQVLPELSTSTPAGLTFMFTGSESYQDATLLVRDPQNKVPTFRQRLDAGSGVPTIREQAAEVAEPVSEPVIRETPPPAGPKNSKPAADNLALEADGPVLVDPSGFALTLTKVPEGIDWSTAKFYSTHPILALNTTKFTLEAPLSGSRTVLHLKRDALALPDAVYGVLTEMLCDSASVPLRFEFARGISLEVSAKFKQRSIVDSDAQEPADSGILK
jgi:hypothetical protein